MKSNQNVLTVIKQQYPEKRKVENPIAKFVNSIYSENTKEAYNRDIHQFFKFKGIESPSEDLKNVNTYDLIQYINSLRKKYSPATVNRKISAVSTLFSFIKDVQINGENIRKDNPVKSKFIKRPKVSNEGVTPGLSKTKMQELIRHIDKNKNPIRRTRDRALVLLMAFNGLRVGSVLPIKMNDFYEDQGYRILRVGLKGGRTGISKINQVTWRAIQEYIQLAPVIEGEYLFRSHNGDSPRKSQRNGMTRQQVNRIIEKYSSFVGVKISPHSMRVFSASEAMRNGAPLQKVQDFLHHANINTTMRYWRDTNRLDDNGVDYVHLVT